MPIDVLSFKLIEGQIRNYQRSPRAQNDQKSPGRIGLNFNFSYSTFENVVLFSALEPWTSIFIWKIQTLLTCKPS